MVAGHAGSGKHALGGYVLLERPVVAVASTVNRPIFASLNFRDFLEPASLRWQRFAKYWGHLNPPTVEVRFHDGEYSRYARLAKIANINLSRILGSLQHQGDSMMSLPGTLHCVVDTRHSYTVCG